MIIEIENITSLTFNIDGDCLCAGSWKADGAGTIAPNGITRIELESGTSGASGLIWWIDSEDKTVYISMSFSFPRLGTKTFACFAGLPPANLKSEKAKPIAEAGCAQDDGSCEWISTAEGVKVRIVGELQSYRPSTADDYTEEIATAATPDADGAGDFLAKTRPKDGTDGVVRGLKTAGGGVAAGLASMVVAPVAGAKQGGALGFAKGLGMGLAAGAALTVGGVAAGVAQVGRGVAQVRTAHRARREEKVWDQELGKWVDVDLCFEEAKLKDEEAREASGTAEKHEVKETDYYDLLCVDPSATMAEIKKAYYKEARSVHPDKNPGDAAATARFQELSQVYQVLSDPDKRKKYDREGKDGFADQKQVQMDPTAFFALLFGSEKFVPWTGELNIAMQADKITKAMDATEGEEESGDVDLKKRQHHREVACAVQLRENLTRAVNDRDWSGFEDQMRLVAHELSSSQFGPELLISLGELYKLRAENYLTNELVGRISLAHCMSSMKQNKMKMRHGAAFYSNAAGSLMRAKNLHAVASKGYVQGEVEEKEADEHAKKMEKALDEALPTFMRTAWTYVVRDLDVTMKGVSRKLLQDKSVPWQIRIRRAQALERLGEIFQEEGHTAKASSAGGPQASEEVKAHLQEALHGALREKK